MKRRRRNDVIRFLTVLVSIVGGSHWYMASRLIRAPQWLPAVEYAGLIGIAGLCLLLLASPFATRFFPPRRVRLVAWLSYLWMGLSFYLLLGLWLSDLVLLLGPWPWHDADTQRTRAVIVVGAAVGIGVIGLFGALRTPAVRRLEVVLPRWPRSRDGYRLVQMSDIHIGPILQRGFAAKIVARANSLQPDLVALTGDIVDGSVDQLEPEVAPFAGLQAPDGVYFATGNHDHYAGASAWTAHFKRLGLRVLYNEHAVVGEADSAFIIAGVSDRSASEERDDVRAALLDAPALPSILLAHHPQTFAKARHFGVDLQVSGHTHGGQMWPFTYLVNLQTRWVAGLYRLGDASLYVSRGTGFWGPPMRVLAPAEITELVLRAPAAS